jgi:hypothetical protein
MKISTNNSDHQARITHLRQSLKRVIERVRKIQRPELENALQNEALIFAYLFGTRIPKWEVCDLFSLLDTSASSLSLDAHEGRDTSNGFESLRSIAVRYGQEHWVRWARRFIDDHQAQKLASRLEKDQRSAQKLSELLPRSAASAYTSAISGEMGFNSDVKKAKSLVLDLISRDDVQLEETEMERDKRILATKLEIISERLTHNDTSRQVARPVADIPSIWDRATGEKSSQDADHFLYGNTPMRGALDTVRIRVERERALRKIDRVVLFLLSDGHPTDGDPLPIAEELKNGGSSCVVLHDK